MAYINSNRLRSLYSQIPRLTYKQIAQELNLSVNVVTYEITKLQDTGQLPSRLKNGTPLGLTQSQIDRLQTIANLRAEGLTWTQIGDQLGVSKDAIRAFIAAHLPELFAYKAKRRHKG